MVLASRGQRVHPARWLAQIACKAAREHPEGPLSVFFEGIRTGTYLDLQGFVVELILAWHRHRRRGTAA
jgi:hypothetical protein